MASSKATRHRHDYYPIAWAARGWDDEDYPTMRRPGVEGQLKAWLKEHGRSRPRGFYPPRMNDPVLWHCRTCIDTIDYVEAFKLKMLDSIEAPPPDEERRMIDDRLYERSYKYSGMRWPMAEMTCCRNCRTLHVPGDLCDIAPLRKP